MIYLTPRSATLTQRHMGGFTECDADTQKEADISVYDSSFQQPTPRLYSLLSCPDDELFISFPRLGAILMSVSQITRPVRPSHTYPHAEDAGTHPHRHR